VLISSHHLFNINFIEHFRVTVITGALRQTLHFGHRNNYLTQLLLPFIQNTFHSSET